MSLFQNGLETLNLGSDSIYVPIKNNDMGSIIGYVLASNIYKECLIKNNYMEIASKIKGLGKQIKLAQTFKYAN